METCYDYFACKKTECIMFQSKSDKPCWDTPGTLCCFPTMKLIENAAESDKCNFCLYRNDYDMNHIPPHNDFELPQSN